MSGAACDEIAASDHLITEEQLKQVLRVDKGSDALLDTWKVIDFTKLGDNYACRVVALEVSYSYKTEKKEACYVLKLNPLRKDDGLSILSNSIFMKEATFYSNILPDLNATLKSIGQQHLNLPKYYHSVLEVDKEQIYFEDLRKKGFKMFDRRKGMDIAHATLVLIELARMHAASLVLQVRKKEPLEETYSPTLDDIFLSEAAKGFFFPILEGSLSNAIRMLEKIGGYERAISFVEGLKPQLESIFTTEMTNGKYDVVCHGDCWNNNTLFRYDNNGNPLEVMLLDLQVTRKASPATDLNYFLFNSLVRDVRKPNLPDLLNCYYKNFAVVMKAGGVEMPFTEDELMEEFRSKSKLGAIFGMMCLPLLLLESEEIHDRDKSGTGFKEMIEDMNEKGMSMINTHPLMKPRFLSIFDDLFDMGIYK